MDQNKDYDVHNMFTKKFKICIDKMIFWVYNRGGWAGIDNK